MPETSPKHQWIGAFGNVVAPFFRRELTLDHLPIRSELLISGLGYHEAWINGERVGDHVLDPAQTDYERRVFFVRHDVTALLRLGENALGAILGSGWYHQHRVWGPQGLSYGLPRLMFELRLTYADGSAETVRADGLWQCSPGPITADNVYAGECYDARLEIDGWCNPGFDASTWVPAGPMPPPGGNFEEQTLPPMRRIEELQPASMATVGAGVVIDFGQNFSGWIRIRPSAPRGREIAMRFAETVFPDGSVDTGSTGVFATGVEQIDRYICKGGGAETWEPRFTYHGFRYVEITGWPGLPAVGDVTGIVVHTDLPRGGAFECSDERLNRLHRMVLWTHRSNAHGIPEDCPARERCGWLGDANLVAEYSLWNFDSRSFWEKHLDDIETTRAGNGGIPAMIAPGKRGTQGHAPPDWAAAFIMIPWYLHQFSGDPAVIDAHWTGMTQLMAHFASIAEEWVLPGGFGDFFDPGTDDIVQHTPQTLSTTLWFHRCATVMAAMAEALGETGQKAMYREWQGAIAAAVRDRYFDEVAGSFGSQGANVLALAFGTLPDREERILAALTKDIRDRSDHMNVGVMGVRYILEELTRRGFGELALALMRQNTYPGFGHLVERGATTLWECWGETGHDKIHGPRSLSHPFMGGFDNWFFNTLAGIRIDPENPGFAHFFLEPHPIDGLHWVRCQHDSPRGRIESDWQVNDGQFVWNVAVPEGAIATARLPFSKEVRPLTAGTHTLRDQHCILSLPDSRHHPA